MRLIALFASNFIVSFGCCGLIANLLISPLYRDRFGSAMRAPDDAGGLPVMALGFVVAAVATVWIYDRLDQARGAIGNGILVGLVAAILVVAEYLKLIGWSTLPPDATVLSGLLSAIGPFLGALAMASVDRLFRR